MKIRLFCAFLPVLIMAGCAQSPVPAPDSLLPKGMQQLPDTDKAEKIDADLSSSERTKPSDNEIVFDDVRYVIGNEKVRGFLAQPNTSDHIPAVILIHEWWGLNDDMKDLAKDFARMGYAALAVDLYEGRVAADQNEARELSSRVQANTDDAFVNLRSAVDYLRAMGRVNDDRIATVGWCFGGGWAYQMAKNDLGVRASIMYYGRFNAADDLSRMKADILGHFGEKDASIKIDDVEQFQATLKTLSGDHEVYIYPNAGHGFANPDNPNFDKEAADLAWQRTLDFLQKNL